MINLSKRLKTIANFVDKGSIIADIGCDHALLDIYLSQNNIIKKSVACDITKGALNGAIKNVKKYNIANIDLRLSDGLNEIKTNDNIDTIVMSGLGDIKIISIIDKNTDKLKNVNTIIIQSNVGVKNIRKYMMSIGYLIENEKLVKDNNIIYTVIKFVRGIKKYSNKQIEYGPILLLNKNNLFKELCENKIDKNNLILKQIPKTKIFKRIKIKINNFKIKQVLK